MRCSRKAERSTSSRSVSSWFSELTKCPNLQITRDNESLIFELFIFQIIYSNVVVLVNLKLLIEAIYKSYIFVATIWLSVFGFIGTTFIYNLFNAWVASCGKVKGVENNSFFSQTEVTTWTCLWSTAICFRRASFGCSRRSSSLPDCCPTYSLRRWKLWTSDYAPFFRETKRWEPKSLDRNSSRRPTFDQSDLVWTLSWQTMPAEIIKSWFMTNYL